MVNFIYLFIWSILFQTMNIWEWRCVSKIFISILKKLNFEYKSGWDDCIKCVLSVSSYSWFNCQIFPLWNKLISRFITLSEPEIIWHWNCHILKRSVAITVSSFVSNVLSPNHPNLTGIFNMYFVSLLTLQCLSPRSHVWEKYGYDDSGSV